MYLAVPGLSCTAYGIFSLHCGMWDLIPCNDICYISINYYYKILLPILQARYYYFFLQWGNWSLEEWISLGCKTDLILRSGNWSRWYFLVINSCVTLCQGRVGERKKWQLVWNSHSNQTIGVLSPGCPSVKGHLSMSCSFISCGLAAGLIVVVVVKFCFPRRPCLSFTSRCPSPFHMCVNNLFINKY